MSKHYSVVPAFVVSRSGVAFSFFFRENAKDLCVSFHWIGRRVVTILLRGTHIRKNEKYSQCTSQVVGRSTRRPLAPALVHRRLRPWSRSLLQLWKVWCCWRRVISMFPDQARSEQGDWCQAFVHDPGCVSFCCSEPVVQGIAVVRRAAWHPEPREDVMPHLLLSLFCHKSVAFFPM